MVLQRPIDWKKIKVVIFDVDGTLYDQSRLRRKMLLALLAEYSFKPWKFRDLLILQQFRSERERKAGTACSKLEDEQYQWCASKGKFSFNRTKSVVEKWIFNFPIKYMSGCAYPGTKDFFSFLKDRGITIAIYSDYKADSKLKAMGLEADLVIASTDPEINSLKPLPKGLLYIMEQTGASPEECIFIGDREEMDGECASNAKMPYLIIEKKPFNEFDFYNNLKNQFLSLDSIHYEPDNHPTQSRPVGEY